MATGPIRETPCPLCGADTARLVLIQAGYRIVRCPTCTALYLSPMPTPHELTAHYQNPDYFAGDATQGYADYSAMEKALRPFFQRRLHTLVRYLPQRGMLLDIGCAAGYFLTLARADGWQIAGVELAAAMGQQAAHMLGIPIATHLDELPADIPYDAITLWEVIEHLPDPVVQLRRLYARLRPGGVLMLSTPNTNHWQAHRDPQHWQGYRPPSHVMFFTPTTLEDALRRAGFTTIHIQRTAPLPPIPGWLRPLSAPLEHKLANGQLAPGLPWQVGLWLWRGVRVGGWGWQRVRQPNDDMYATLEALAVKDA
ncbi:MAG: class I SAM-dependent methyltransferase [Chloroflexaceae bacterium]|nr:class I SAM-dependent methyltransferase [Chloroflexaceae bacterium]